MERRILGFMMNQSVLTFVSGICDEHYMLRKAPSRGALGYTRCAAALLYARLQGVPHVDRHLPISAT